MLRSCASKETGSTDLPLNWHPTQVELDGFALPHHAGCLIMNSIIIAGFALVHFATAVLLSKALGKSPAVAQGMVRFPLFSILGAVVLMQGPAFAGARLFRDAHGLQDTLLGGLFVAVALVGVPGVLHHTGKLGKKESIFKLDPHARSGCRKQWIGSGEWLSLPPERMAVERLGISFRATMPGVHWVIAVEVLVGQISLVSAGLAPSDCDVCAALRLLDVCLSLLLAAIVLRLRPFTRPLRLPLMVAGQGLMATAGGAFAVGLFSDQCGEASPAALPGHRFGEAILMLASFVTVLISLNDASAWLRAVSLRRRGHLTKVLEDFNRLDADGSGNLSREELRTGMRQIYRRKIPEDEFAKLFNAVDADGSGDVDLREFLECEHLFWDAGSETSEVGDIDAAEFPSSLLSTVHLPQSGPVLARQADDATGTNRAPMLPQCHSDPLSTFSSQQGYSTAPSRRRRRRSRDRQLSSIQGSRQGSVHTIEHDLPLLHIDKGRDTADSLTRRRSRPAESLSPRRSRRLSPGARSPTGGLARPRSFRHQRHQRVGGTGLSDLSEFLAREDSALRRDRPPHERTASSIAAALDAVLAADAAAREEDAELWRDIAFTDEAVDRSPSLLSRPRGRHAPLQSPLSSTHPGQAQLSATDWARASTDV